MAKKESKTLDELFHDTLKDIYFAEKKILATLPKMEKAAQCAGAQTGFRQAQNGDRRPRHAAGKGLRGHRQEAARQDLRCHRRHHRRRRGNHEGIQRFASPRRRPSRGGAGGRTLRNLPLRHAQDLG